MLFITALVFAQTSDLSRVAVIYDNGNWIKFLPDSHIEVSQFFAEFQKDLNLSSDYKFELLKKETDALGMSHFRYQQTFKGLPIEGATYMLHVKDGRLSHANGNIIRGIDGGSSSSMTSQSGLTIAKEFMGSNVFYWEMPEMEARIKHIKKDPAATFYPEGELVYAQAKFDSDGSLYTLARKYEIFAPQPAGTQTIFVDASSGVVLFALEDCHEGSAEGIAETRYSGTQTIITDSISENEFRLVDVTRGGGIETYDMNEGENLSMAVNFLDADNYWDNANEQFDEAATDVHWGMEQSYDYFLDVHGRDSFDGEGAPIISYVHVGTGWFNATFNGLWARFGDGNGNPLTSIDVVAHELSHGVTRNSAQLVYQDESGALNESFSDVFGTAVEFFAREEEANWILGEANFILRNLENPNEFEQPDTYFGTYWVTGEEDHGGVHTNSGVQNYWFYLLCTGGQGVNDNGDDFSVDSIGMDKAAAIAYRNLTVYLAPNSTYLEARLGALQAAEDLYGSCSDEVTQVRKAWHAVGVGAGTLSPDIQLLEVISPLNSGCILGDNEPVELSIRYTPSGCSISLEIGDEIEVSYQINDEDPIVETIILTEALNEGDVFNYVFQTPADLSELGQSELNFSVNLEGDTYPNNDGVDGFQLTNPIPLVDGSILAFEVFPVVTDSFYVETRAHSEASVSSAAANTGNRGFRLNGVGTSFSDLNPIVSEETNFTDNPEFVSRLCVCVDASTWDEAYLSFDLRQTFSQWYFLNLGDAHEWAIALQVLVDDVPVGDQFHPTTNDSDPYLTHVMDFNEYAGTAFTLCFQGVHYINIEDDPISGSSGDISQLDNIFLFQNETLSVEQVRTTEAKIYPNPSSGIVLVQINEIGLQKVSVLDLLGNELQTENWNATGSQLELDLSKLASGVYFISIQSETVNVVQKVVLE